MPKFVCSTYEKLTDGKRPSKGRRCEKEGRLLIGWGRSGGAAWLFQSHHVSLRSTAREEFRIYDCAARQILAGNCW